MFLRVYLSVIMLGFIVTRSVLDPTSLLYISEIGGILHLKKRLNMMRLFQNFPMTYKQTHFCILPEDKVSGINLSSTLAVFDDTAVPDDSTFLKLGFGIGHVLQSKQRIHSETGQEEPKWDYRDDCLEMVAWQLLQA